MSESAGCRSVAFSCEVNLSSCCKEYSALNLQIFCPCLCDADVRWSRTGGVDTCCLATWVAAAFSKGTPGSLAQQRGTCRSFRQHKLVIGCFQYWEWGAGPSAEQAIFMLKGKGFASMWYPTKAKVLDKTHKHQVKKLLHAI